MLLVIAPPIRRGKSVMSPWCAFILTFVSGSGIAAVAFAIRWWRV
jgi:hypothetical protein